MEKTMSVEFGGAVLVTCEDCGATIACGLTAPGGRCVALHAVPICAAFEGKVRDSVKLDVERMVQG